MYDSPEVRPSYHEGFRAYPFGDIDNPYPPDSEDYGLWEDGWYAAFKEFG